MNRNVLVSFAALAALTSLPGTGCKLLKKGGADGDGAGASGSPGGGSGGPAGEVPKGKPGSGCKLPEGGVISADFTIPKGCAVSVKENIVINGGATLKIEPGARLAFASGTVLGVEEGKLLARGTEKEPIVFTSAAKTQAAGDWAGIMIHEAVMAGTEISNARIEYAGRNEHYALGALSLADQRSAGRVTVVQTTFSNNDQAGVGVNNDKGTFAKFEKNVLKNNKISFRAPAAVLGSIGAGNTFGDPLETHGTVTEPTTWQAFGVPVLVTEHLKVQGEKSAPTLTLAPGTVMKFAGGSVLSVGEGNGGGLIARQVTFTSSNATPHPGDWVGLALHERSTNVVLEGSTFEYAGSTEHYGKGAITFHDTTANKARGVRISKVTFKNVAQSGIASSDGDCGTFVRDNTATGAPLCHPAH